MLMLLLVLLNAVNCGIKAFTGVNPLQNFFKENSKYVYMVIGISGAILLLDMIFGFSNMFEKKDKETMY